MANGWVCENCNQFHNEVHLVTKITVSLNPREYAAEITLCSLKCFDEYRPDLDDQQAYAQEHTPPPRIRHTLSTEQV